MKKLLALFAALLILIPSFAIVGVEVPPKKASEMFIPIGNTGNKISLQELSVIKESDFEIRSGHRMDFFNRLSFHLAQKKLRKSINADGTINNKRIQNYFKKVDGSGGFHFGGFALGFFVGLIGVLIAYLINDDLKSTRVKWAWIGFGIFVVLYLALVLALLSTYHY